MVSIIGGYVVYVSEPNDKGHIGIGVAEIETVAPIALRKAILDAKFRASTDNFSEQKLFDLNPEVVMKDLGRIMNMTTDEKRGLFRELSGN